MEPTVKANPVRRGCGEREPGGCYAECGMGPGGSPLETFLFDPPEPIPAGLDIINKPQVWYDPNTGTPHLLIWIGAEHYPYVADYLEEVRRYGASRRLNPNLDLQVLTKDSLMILAHPKAINTGWQDMSPPAECAKGRPGHSVVGQTEHGQPPEGPCLFKLWDLIPIEAATETISLSGEPLRCLRQHASTIYSYCPTGESARLTPGLIAALPITGFALIKHEDGSVNKLAKAKLMEADRPFYESEE